MRPSARWPTDDLATVRARQEHVLYLAVCGRSAHRHDMVWFSFHNLVVARCNKVAIVHYLGAQYDVRIRASYGEEMVTEQSLCKSPAEASVLPA